jgi:hypothetical protein
MIAVETVTDEGRMSASITFTSMSIRQQENAITITSEHLGKGNCLKALYAMHSVQWFQVRVAGVLRSASILSVPFVRITSANVNMHRRSFVAYDTKRPSQAAGKPCHLK